MEIRIYFEGDRVLRRGFSYFFEEIVSRARQGRHSWALIACGSRTCAFEDFATAVASRVEAVNILLVDAEAPVSTVPSQHLAERDKWENPGVRDENLHLMTQVMEAWFIADVDALRRFYGQRFNATPISRNPNVESIPKNDVYAQLDAATRQCLKGPYHNTRHAPDLLQQISPERVRTASANARRLFERLFQLVGE